MSEKNRPKKRSNTLPQIQISLDLRSSSVYPLDRAWEKQSCHMIIVHVVRTHVMRTHLLRSSPIPVSLPSWPTLRQGNKMLWKKNSSSQSGHGVWYHLVLALGHAWQHACTNLIVQFGWSTFHVLSARVKVKLINTKYNEHTVQVMFTTY